jgi:hypothetical protein
MSVLVRELNDTQAGARCELFSPRHPASGSRCTPHDWLQEMGSYHLDHDPSCPERNSACVAVHLQTEAYQPDGQG